MAARAIVAAARGDWFLAGCYIVLAALFWQRRGIVDAALYARLHEEARKRAGVE